MKFFVFSLLLIIFAKETAALGQASSQNPGFQNIAVTCTDYCLDEDNKMCDLLNHCVCKPGFNDSALSGTCVENVACTPDDCNGHPTNDLNKANGCDCICRARFHGDSCQYEGCLGYDCGSAAQLKNEPDNIVCPRTGCDVGTCCDSTAHSARRRN